ncbi:WW domain [Quillaja saponaria]|uniref:WW domain n=1 Tax=Quillaja saponaria TaxID=32244 RepID=A0AAD7LFQ3_QUISA|nr:WW domain [Quillaja saponaria]
MIMELTELSLAPTQFVLSKNRESSSESENNPSRKRKLFQDHLLIKTVQAVQESVDLQLKNPLPLDWEQCLDLESGRMYYMNRKTLRKSWNCPKDQKLDLELNISSHSNSPEEDNSSASSPRADSKKRQYSSSSTSNMVALACLNCHLLVILSKSSPSCPNCKYVHSLPMQQAPAPLKASGVKPLNTFSFLN